jgi:hypothetical protein
MRKIEEEVSGIRWRTNRKLIETQGLQIATKVEGSCGDHTVMLLL